MGIVYRVDREKGITLAVWDGPVTEEQVLVHLRRMLADPDWPGPRRMHLADLRTTNASVSLGETSIKTIVTYLGTFSNKITGVKMAIVANEAYQISNTFQHLVSRLPFTVIVFNSLDTACTWLNIPAEEAERALEQLRSGLRGDTDLRE